jgi:hypothetical protein
MFLSDHMSTKCKFMTKQVLGLLLANDNGTSAKYIRKHHLVLFYLFTVDGNISVMFFCRWD